MNKEVIRTEIHRFIADRLAGKLEKLKPDETQKRDELIRNHQPETWLADAAKRAAQIRLATHTLKAIHPDARGSVVNMQNDFCTDERVVGTHSLAVRADDVVGNAAALDVFKLLKLEVGGETLLSRLLRQDSDAVEALADQPSQTAELAAQLLAVAGENEGAVATHTLAKQVYFPIGDDTYHLLAPLFPSAVAHTLHASLQASRFSDEAKAARTAKREARADANGYSDLLGLAFVSMGGSKPQNISQLNSERGGKGHLLAAGPPLWQSEAIKPPRGESVFDGAFTRRKHVRELTTDLREFLIAVNASNRNNVDIRIARSEKVTEIVDAFVLYVSTLFLLPTGWSMQNECELDVFERVAFDPLADHDDEDLKQTRDWPAVLATRFAAWLNGAIRTDTTPMGADEQRDWKHQVTPLLDDLADSLAEMREAQQPRGETANGE
jgi:CRISPR-associated protein Csy1